MHDDLKHHDATAKAWAQIKTFGGFMLKATLMTALVAVAASTSFAGQRENFNACAANDESWMRRFGHYVVAFNRNAAYDECRKQIWWGESQPRQAVCRLNGAWAKAGYYCEEMGGD